jgi:hypothetical protein
MELQNGDAVIPKVYTRVEWYQERLNELTESIYLLEINFSEKNERTHTEAIK